MQTLGQIFDKIKYASNQPDLVWNDGTKETGYIKICMLNCLNLVNETERSYEQEVESELSLVGGTSEYSLPSNIGKLKSVYVDDEDKKLIVLKLENEAFLRIFDEQYHSDKTLYYTIKENKIKIYPIPETSSSTRCHLIYTKKATSFDISPSSNSGKDTNVEIKYGFEELVYLYVMNDIYKMWQNFAGAREFKREFDELLVKYKNELLNQADTGVVKYGEEREVNEYYPKF